MSPQLLWQESNSRNWGAVPTPFSSVPCPLCLSPLLPVPCHVPPCCPSVLHACAYPCTLTPVSATPPPAFLTSGWMKPQVWVLHIQTQVIEKTHPSWVTLCISDFNSEMLCICQGKGCFHLKIVAYIVSQIIRQAIVAFCYFKILSRCKKNILIKTLFLF